MNVKRCVDQTKIVQSKAIAYWRLVVNSEVACKVKKRIRDVWFTGARGKAILIGVPLALLLAITFSFSGGSTKKSDDYFKLGKGDLKTRYPSESMFVATNREDISNCFVVANPRKMPKWMAKERLEWMVCANSEVEKKSRRLAYLSCERDFTIAHVASDHVIARSCRDDYVYIKTDEDYVEGNMLKPGLYRFIGNRTVPLITGSSARLHAFEMIDVKISEAVYEAHKWNLELESVVEKENRRRGDVRCRTEFDNCVKGKLKNIRFPMVAEMIRYPKGADEFVKKAFEDFGSDAVWQCRHSSDEKIKGSVINGWIHDCKNDELLKFTNKKIDGAFSGDKIADDVKDALEHLVWYMCYFDVPKDGEYHCYVVKPESNFIRELQGSNWEEVYLNSRIYILKSANMEQFSANMTVEKFVAKFNELYGVGKRIQE